MKHLIFGIKYLANYWIKGKAGPLICGLVLHNKCNLRCLHCTLIKRPAASMSFAEAKKVIDSFYGEGGRCLYLEGGEPFMWHDKTLTINDIVNYAKDKRYHAVIIYTNGTYPINSDADTIFVSIDGLLEKHDQLRGQSFEKIIKNIKASTHPSIYVNFTINSVNKEEIEDFCKYTDCIKQIKGTFFYFHTPYYGQDDLFLENAIKTETLKLLLKLKSRYKILNSSAAIKSAIRNDWKKNLDICRVYEDGVYYKCCRQNNKGDLCRECGYLSYAEIDQTLKLKPGAIINALKYF